MLPLLFDIYLGSLLLLALHLPPPLLPKALPITHQNLLPLPNPSRPAPVLATPLLPRAHHPHPDARLPPALAKHGPKLGIRPRSHAAVVIHEPRLVALQRRVHRHVGLLVQPQVVVRRRRRAVAAVYAAKVRQDKRPRLEVLRRKEARLPVGRVRGRAYGLDLDACGGCGCLRGGDCRYAAAAGAGGGRRWPRANGGEVCLGQVLAMQRRL